MARTRRSRQHTSHQPTSHQPGAAARRARPLLALATAVALALGAGLAALPAQAVDPSGQRLWVDPHSSTFEAAAALEGRAKQEAVLLGGHATATWLTGDKGKDTRAEAERVTRAAQADGSVPTLVVYDLPFRDCAQYSAGGAKDTAEYESFVDEVAAGIGDRDAIVILEPDGLGIIPWWTPYDGTVAWEQTPGWCQPAELDSATAADDRFTQLSYAVDRLTGLDGTSVYLDGTHSSWLGAGDAADRLVRAGVEKADGFFLNASNYEATENLTAYAGWVSDCIALSTQGPDWFVPAYCASQYSGLDGFDAADVSTWGAVDDKYTADFASLGLTRDREHQAHAVLDTSRNGQGPWTGAPAGGYTPGDGDASNDDPEVWCNPPGRGVGETPSTTTPDAVVDAYLWIKVPGESDGQCYRGTDGPQDPERGTVDPPAGGWFPEMAHELVTGAQPALARPTCAVGYTVHGAWPQGFTTQLWVQNTGTSTLRGWDLQWWFEGGQRIQNYWSSDVVQVGNHITASNLSWNATLRPGERTTFGFVGASTSGPGADALYTLLGGKPCSVLG
ncbi:glycoside hydrolase family 6 protein [Cellulomonas sp. PhB143]|uniref:glycoside hydrolase family 6 protein n=1 Tax=Cellulomonas sp. PhB143 TaxID=2485186 RepID=UPI000F4A5766|nr:glycoside hydrolase family 6 protein [Cellulomonas sp. PhB143]ROS78999.1 endoglucanase [Cellulomonas sp. PhB143]